MEPNRAIFFEMQKTSRIIKRHLEREKSKRSIDKSTGNHGRIIGFICTNRERDIFQRDIEKEFNIRRSTATNVLKLMEKNGLITRESVDYDARLKKIVLTQKAYDIHKTVCADFAAFEERLARGISQHELNVFFGVLDKVKSNLKEDDAND